MDEFIKKSAAERAPYIEKAAADLGISELIVEKDFWVTWTLKRLFSLSEISDQLTFKGGTSLSKVYKLIERFSEDIDLSIEKGFLGFKGDKDPEEVVGSNAKKRAIEELSEECKKFIKNKLLPELEEEIKNFIPDGEEWKIELDPSDASGESILFHYPKIPNIVEGGYVKKIIKIEIGAKSDHWPSSNPFVIPIIEEVLNGTFENPKAEIKVLNAERTFWEKATILHVFAHYPDGKTVQERQSRHFYDFYKLLNSEIKTSAASDPALLERVSEHKKLYFAAAWAKYDDAKKGTIKLVPDDRVQKELKADYEAMSEMFYGDELPWEKIIEEIKAFEAEFNS